MSQLPLPPTGTPSAKRALLTLVATLLGAALLLVLVVLPAEYGIDPTGAGRRVGLQRLHPVADDGKAVLPAAKAGAASEYDQAFRQEQVTIDIAARQEIEYKIAMVQGNTVVFGWRTDRGSLYSDFHAEPYNDLNDKPVRYSERDDVSSGNGALSAPYSGYHGWYWRNENEFPVQITLTVAGYFTGFKELHRAPITSPAPSG